MRSGSIRPPAAITSGMPTSAEPIARRRITLRRLPSTWIRRCIISFSGLTAPAASAANALGSVLSLKSVPSRPSAGSTRACPSDTDTRQAPSPSTSRS